MKGVKWNSSLICKDIIAFFKKINEFLYLNEFFLSSSQLCHWTEQQIRNGFQSQAPVDKNEDIDYMGRERWNDSY